MKHAGDPCVIRNDRSVVPVGTRRDVVGIRNPPLKRWAILVASRRDADRRGVPGASVARYAPATRRNLNLHGQTNVVDDVGNNLATFGGEVAIIAILDCSEDELMQSLVVNGPAQFVSAETGSFMQLNRCDEDAPVMEIGWNQDPNSPPSEKPAVVLFNPNDPSKTAFLSPNVAELTDIVLNLRTCLNSIELLVKCGHPSLAPAGIWMDPETLKTQSYADFVQAEELSAEEAFIDEITTYELTEINGNDPF